MGIQDTDPLSQLTLPPGFRFYPTDEELLVQYLCRKVAGHHFALQIIAEIDLYKFDPWVLPSKALFGEKEWYFFSPRDRKYPNGSRPNRVAGSGYWKATGTDKIITTEGRKVGIKKALVFYVGKAPKGTKTNWIMHEYRLSDPPKTNASSRLDEWVLCRIYKKNSSGAKPVFSGLHSIEQSHGSSSSSSSQFDDMLESLTETDQDQYFSLPKMNNSLRTFQQDDQKPLNLQHLGSGNIDWASLAGLNTLPELGQGNQAPVHVNNNDINNNLSNLNDFFTHPATLNYHGDTTKLGGVVDEEVQSGIRNRQLDNLGFFQHQNSNGFSNSVDPFGIRYPDHTVNPLYRQ